MALAYFIAVLVPCTFVGEHSPGRQVAATPPNIEGEWSLIYNEAVGKAFSSILDEQTIASDPIRRESRYFVEVWKIGKDTMTFGLDIGEQPRGRYDHHMHPAGPGTINMWITHKDGTKTMASNRYHLKDGFLFISSGVLLDDEQGMIVDHAAYLASQLRRPEGIASEKRAGSALMILRKGRIK